MNQPTSKHNLSEEREYRMEEKLANTPAALKRDLSRNYFKGYFFITLSVHDHLPILGTMEGHYDTIHKQVINANVRPTSLGERVLHIWQTIPSFHPNVQLIDAQLMPEHFHGLIFLDSQKSGTPQHLGKIIGGFMISCTHEYWDILGIDWKSTRGHFGKKSDYRWTDKLHSHSLRGPSLFSAGYNEVSPITQEEVETKIRYIHSNPERRIIKGAQKDCFTMHRNNTSKNWTIGNIVEGLKHDSFLANHPEALQESIDTIYNRILQNSTTQQLHLDYIGDRKILFNTCKLPLICHRIDSDLFDCQKEAVLNQAREGAVIVSAFISPKEREILHQLLAEGLSVIEIVDNGFNSLYKPYGQNFYHCAEGKLLQITCWTYQYKSDNTISRPMCLIMNELARVISGTKDDWWKN